MPLKPAVTSAPPQQASPNAVAPNTAQNWTKSTTPYWGGPDNNQFDRTYKPKDMSDPAFSDPSLTPQMKSVLMKNMLGEDSSKDALSDEEAAQQEHDLNMANQSDLEKSINEQKNVLGRQLNENKAATTAALAQSREAPMSATNPMTGQQITGAMQSTYNSQVDKLNQTQKAYDQAMQAGEDKTAASLLQSIAQQKKAMADTQAANQKQAMDTISTLSTAGALANLSPADVQTLQSSLESGVIPQNLVGLLTQAATEKALTATQKSTMDLQGQALTQFTNLAKEGIQMTPTMLQQQAQQTGLPVDQLMQFNLDAQGIMNDKTLSTADKDTALNDKMLTLQQHQQGIYGEQMQKMAYIDSLYAQGKSQAEIDSVKTMLGITTDSMQLAKTQEAQANATIKQFEAKYLGKPPPEGSLDRIKYDKAKLDLQEATLKADQTYGGTLDTSTAKETFALAGPSKYGHGEGKRECGEAYNQLTDGAKVADSYASKMKIVTKQDNPQVGNALVIPIGDSRYGHIETVINVSPVTGNFQTVSYNRDGSGSETIQNYNISDLQKYGNNWGFSDSSLKSEFQDKLGKVAGASGAAAGTTGKPDIDATAEGYTSRILGTAGGLTQAAVDQAALQFALTGQMPSIGLGSTGAAGQKREAIQNRAAEMDAGGNIQAHKAELKANTDSLVEQTKYKNQVERSFGNFEDGFKQITNAFEGKVNPSAPIVNILANPVKYGLGQSDIVAFKSGLNEVRTEYQQVISRGGQVSDNVRKTAAEVLDDNVSFETLKKVQDELSQQGQIVVNGAKKQVKQIQDDINNIVGGKSGEESQTAPTQSGIQSVVIQNFLNDPNGKQSEKEGLMADLNQRGYSETEAEAAIRQRYGQKYNSQIAETHNDYYIPVANPAHLTSPDQI
jgi:hypothetical protein